MTIAVELAKLREQRGLSQSQLARMTGMKQPQIARLSGAYMPAFGTLIRILEALKGKLELSPTECRVTPTALRWPAYGENQSLDTQDLPVTLINLAQGSRGFDLSELMTDVDRTIPESVCIFLLDLFHPRGILGALWCKECHS